MIQIDAIKGLAILWIFLNHAAERLFGSPYFGNPTPSWPPFAERIQQLSPLTEPGLTGFLANAVRYVGWTGDQGVQLFLVASGFALTWGLLRRSQGAETHLKEFYIRRAARIYPLWWAVHIVLGLALVAAGRAGPLASPRFFLSLAGFRATPGLFYYLVPAWWFIGLILQLYIIYPFLWKALLRRGPLALLAGSLAVALGARAAGLAFLGDFLHSWSLGAVFVTRLPEFVFGMVLAHWLFRRGDAATDALRRTPVVLICALAYGLGTALSFTYWGMTAAPFLQAAGLFPLLFAAFTRKGGSPRRFVGPLTFSGRHSYSLYLVHHPAILLLIAPLHVRGSWLRDMAAAFLLSVLSALLLEKVTQWIQTRVEERVRRRGAIRAAAGAVLLGLVAGGILLGAELAVRHFDPQEVRGWGERPSLQPDEKLGWRLRPNIEVRLRWESYDYTLKTNSLGFTGPEYPVAKPPGTFRILTTGDAFTSAEGVSTNEAWPRLLERKLNSRPLASKVEVLNFAVSGYGPQQYADVVETYAPRYFVDLVVVGFFVNEYEDVLRSCHVVRSEVGFDSPPQNGLSSLLTLQHLRRLAHLRIGDWIQELRGHPERTHGYFLGNFRALEKAPTFDRTRGVEATQRYLGVAARAAAGCGAKILLMLIPAPVQVCGPECLQYFPRGVHLNDGGIYDLDLPQRITRELAENLRIPTFDLRGVFQESRVPCPYQPRNMHWTARGHEIAADALARHLIAGGYLD